MAKASSDFEYASRLTETMLLGIVALKTGYGRQIKYDGEAGKVTNSLVEGTARVSRIRIDAVNSAPAKKSNSGRVA